MPINVTRALRSTSANEAVGTATGWIPVNTYVQDFDVTFAIVVTAGAGQWRIQHTLDDIFNTNITPRAFDHSTVSAAQATQDGSYGSPIMGLRMVMTSSAVSGNVSATLRVMQGGF